MEMAEYILAAGAEDPGVQILFALRSGTSDLRVDTDRRLGIPHYQRICRFCDTNQVEDSDHVLSSCPAHSSVRASLISKLPHQLQNLEDLEVRNAIMGAANFQSLCPRASVRKEAWNAIKSFWVAVFNYRRSLLNES